jgi:hypothetical protein
VTRPFELQSCQDNEVEEVRVGCHWGQEDKIVCSGRTFSHLKKSNIFFLKKLLIDKLQIHKIWKGKTLTNRLLSYPYLLLVF